MGQKEIRVKIFNSEYNLQGENSEKVEEYPIMLTV